MNGTIVRSVYNNVMLFCIQSFEASYVSDPKTQGPTHVSQTSSTLDGGYGELWVPIVGECSRKLHHFEVLDVDGPLPFSHVRN